MNDLAGDKKILRALAGEAQSIPPIWMMRQAGRYLPEYRALRATSPDFMAFCYDPQKAAEATLQPITRFDLDAAIIFSDILVIPDALGQAVRFEVGEGPRLDPIESGEELTRLRETLDTARLAPVYEALDKVKSKLPAHVALIGFAGAPWTLASYMIAGRGSPDQMAARLFAYREPEAFSRLISLLTRSVAQHLVRQCDAGAEIVQIFDSWAGVLPTAEFEKWCLEPIRAIASEVKRARPDVRIIAFPRGCHVRSMQAVAESPDIDGLSLDTAADFETSRARLGGSVCLQGNLDPIVLLAGGSAQDEAVQRILDAARGAPHIFNLGHGILPPTPIANVERLISRVRAAGS
jgi:uroporphyrinogen decarboxylase